MPWTPQQFADRHNHSLSPAEAVHASHIANAILRGGASERIAIATANKLAEHHAKRAAGGLIPRYDAGGGVGGLTPPQTSGNPLLTNAVQRYQGLPTEKLQELQGMLGGTQQGQVIRSVLQRRLMQPNAGGAVAGQQPGAGGLAPPQTPGSGVAPQAALPASGGGLGPSSASTMQTPISQARGGLIPHRAAGGGMGVSPSMMDPWWTRREASDDGGFLSGSTPGRADAVKTTAPGGSYVLPADVVAHLGEGNSLAGARVWQEILNSGPMGTPQDRPARGMGMPRPPAPMPTGQAKGGGVQGGSGRTPVALSDGEVVVSPEHVAWFGKGDHKRGIKVLDAFVQKQREDHISTLKKLPGPVGSKPLKKAG
jgi:hypothetical protein